MTGFFFSWIFLSCKSFFARHVTWHVCHLAKASFLEDMLLGMFGAFFVLFFVGFPYGKILKQTTMKPSSNH
jgi:hypothetical protein